MTIQLTTRQHYKELFVAGVKLPLALAEQGLIDECEFVLQPGLLQHTERQSGIERLHSSVA